MEREIAGSPVVVLGFGAAAVSAICALRENGYGGPLAVVTDAGPEPYSPVLTSYYAGGRISREQCFPWKDLDVAGMVDELLARREPASVDVAGHAVVLSDGRRVEYSKLLIATGAHPVAPGFPRLEAFQPLMLRTMDDADRLCRALSDESCSRVLVSGTSMVGLKALEACLDRSVGVTMLGRSAHILKGSAHSAVAARFEKLLEQRGVKLRLSQTVEEAQKSGGSTGCLVRFSNGESERFDEIILAQGVKPNLPFVDPQEIEMHDGLAVDQFMRTSAPDVFAAGDVVQSFDLTSCEHRIIGLWSNAVQQGRCAGAAIAAELAGRAPTRPIVGTIPSNTIHVGDILFASAGSVTEGEGKTFEIRETPETLSVFAHERRKGAGRLVGFNVLSTTAHGHKRDALVDEIGKHRQMILNGYREND